MLVLRERLLHPRSELSLQVGCVVFGVRRRHEMPPDPSNPLNKQNIKDRVDGRNDPVAKKILERVALQQQEYEREKKQVRGCDFESRVGEGGGEQQWRGEFGRRFRVSVL